MLDTLLRWDEAAFRWVNGHHNTVADWVFWTITQHWAWAVVMVLFFGLVTLRHDARRWWLVVAGVALCFLLADQGSVHLFKEHFHRLRPCMALDDVRMFRIRCGKPYGFVSSHAANAFAIAVLLALRYRRRPWAVASILLWAVATSYSRAYLGKHYPGDLICGAIFGAAIGLIVWAITEWCEKSLKKLEQK